MERGRFQTDGAGVPSEGSDPSLRKRQKIQPSSCCGRCEIPEYDPKGMMGADFIVSVRHHEHRAHALQPPPEETQQVEGGLVGPVRVLDHGERRCQSAVQLRKGGAEHPVTRRVATEQPVELATSGRGKIQERPERSRRGENVAGAPQHTCSAVRAAAEPIDEGSFPDARLSTDEDESPAAVHRFAQPPVQRHERQLTFL